MRTPFKASPRIAASFVLATASFSLLALHCGTDDGTQPGGGAGTTMQPTSGSGGSAATQAGSGGMTTGGVPTAGSSSGGAGTGTGGTLPTAGTAGSGGSGGGAGSSAGASGSGGGGGGTGGSSGVSFGPVKELLSKTCAGAKCHDAASMQVDWITADGLYMRLTTALPQDTPHCPGNIPVIPGNPDGSLLLQAIKGKPTCNKAGGGMETIARMPDDCSTTGTDPRPCLTDTQIKLVSDWIAAGAPMQ
jgi:hypothetical protein